MAMALVKSIWEAGSLVFRRRDTLAGVLTIAPQGPREWASVSDIDAQTGTLTAARILTGIIVHTSAVGAGTLTFDTAANILAAFPGIQVGEVIKFYLINDGTQTDTIASDGGTTVTLGDVGQTIAADESALFLLLVTDITTAAITAYQIGA